MKENKERKIIKSFSKYVKSYDRHALIQKAMGNRLAGLLPEALPSPVLEIGCGTGLFTRHLMAFNPTKLILNDLAPAMIRRLERQIHLPTNIKIIIGNAEKLSFPKVQLIAANAVFQWFDSPANSLKNLEDSLKPNGRLIFSTFGPQTLKELRKIADIPSQTNLLTRSNWEKIISQADLELIEFQMELRKVFFPSALSFLKNLQQSGTSTLRLMRVGRLRQVIRKYDLDYSTRQGVYATWEIYYFSVRKSK